RGGPQHTIERVDRREFGIREFEAEDGEVRGHPVARGGLRAHDDAALQVPADHDLGGRHAVRIRRILHRLLAEEVVLALAERPPSLGTDAERLGEGTQLTLLESGVQLHLVDGRHGARLGDDALEVGAVEVRDADRAALAVVADLLHREPGLDVAVEVGTRPVDEVEVHVVQTQLLEAQVDRVEGRLGALVGVPQLRRDEELLARDARLLDRPTDSHLVAVHGGGVDVAVADLEGVGDDALGLVGVDLEHPEPELGDGAAVVEFDEGNRHAFHPVTGAHPAPARPRPPGPLESDQPVIARSHSTASDQETAMTQLGIAAEPPAENRVSLSPPTAARVAALGYTVVVERDAGAASAFPDTAYEAAGVTVVDGDAAWASDVVLAITPPSPADIARLRPGATFVGLLSPALRPELLEQLAARGVTALALDAVPRISRAQSMDVLSSMANIAGYRAVVEAAHEFGRFFTGQVTAAGKVPPAAVLVAGAGVAGLAAIGAASSLGAIVRATDPR